VEGIVVDAGYEARVQAAMEWSRFRAGAILAVLRKRSEPGPEQEVLAGERRPPGGQSR